MSGEVKVQEQLRPGEQLGASDQEYLNALKNKLERNDYTGVTDQNGDNQINDADLFEQSKRDQMFNNLLTNVEKITATTTETTSMNDITGGQLRGLDPNRADFTSDQISSMKQNVQNMVREISSMQGNSSYMEIVGLTSKTKVKEGTVDSNNDKYKKVREELMGKLHMSENDPLTDKLPDADPKSYNNPLKTLGYLRAMSILLNGLDGSGFDKSKLNNVKFSHQPGVFEDGTDGSASERGVVINKVLVNESQEELSDPFTAEILGKKITYVLPDAREIVKRVLDSKPGGKDTRFNAVSSGDEKVFDYSLTTGTITKDRKSLEQFQNSKDGEVKEPNAKESGHLTEKDGFSVDINDVPGSWTIIGHTMADNNTKRYLYSIKPKEPLSITDGKVDCNFVILKDITENSNGEADKILKDLGINNDARFKVKLTPKLSDERLRNKIQEAKTQRKNQQNSN